MATEAPAAGSTTPAAAPTPRVDVAACARSAAVPRFQGSLALPERLVRATLAPAYAALCACLDSGTTTNVRITLRPAVGTSRAEVGDPTLQHCVARELGEKKFSPFVIGGDCIDCGPKRYGVFRGSAPLPTKPPATTIVLGLAFTRP
jgi:hypothetical protein